MEGRDPLAARDADRELPARFRSGIPSGLPRCGQLGGHEEHPQQPATQAEDGDEEVPLPHGLVMEPTQVLEPSNESAESEHPPPSETSSTTLEASPVHPIGPSEMPPQAVKPETDGNHVPSANRLSISYAAGTRRMVIDSAIVEKLKVFRSDARIEVHMTINEEAGNLKGILVSTIANVRVLTVLILI